MGQWLALQLCLLFLALFLVCRAASSGVAGVLFSSVLWGFVFALFFLLGLSGLSLGCSSLFSLALCL